MRRSSRRGLPPIPGQKRGILHLAFSQALVIGPSMHPHSRTRPGARLSPARVLILAGAATALALTGGCAGRNKASKDTAYVARDEETLYMAAKARHDRGVVIVAAALFDEGERQHPYSVWARRAQLMSAFSYYVGS